MKIKYTLFVLVGIAVTVRSVWSFLPGKVLDSNINNYETSSALRSEYKVGLNTSAINGKSILQVEPVNKGMPNIPESKEMRYYETDEAQDSAKLSEFRSAIGKNCQSCMEIEEAISLQIKNTCHVDESLENTESIIDQHPLYAFLSGVRSVSEDVYIEAVRAASYNVNCEDANNWTATTASHLRAYNELQ